MTQLFIQNQFDQMPASVLIWLHLLCCCQSLSRTLLFVTLWTAASKDSLSFTISQSLLKFMSTESVMSSNHLSSVSPFSFCLQSFPASGSFPVSQPIVSGDQSTGASASALVLPMNISWLFSFRTGLISLLSKGL